MTRAGKWTVLVPAVVAAGIALAPARAVATAADTTKTDAFTSPTDEERRELKRTLQQVGTRHVDAPAPWQQEKNPRLAMLSSAVLPGLGQVYNGRHYKVGVMLGFMCFYGGNMILNWQQHKYWEGTRNLSAPGSIAFENADRLSQFHEDQAIDFMWWTGAVWLLGIIDSWIDAHLYDVRVYSPETRKETAPPAEPQMKLGAGSGSDGTRYLTFSLGL